MAAMYEYLLIYAFNQPEVKVVCGLVGSACVVYEYHSGRIRLPHL